MDELPFINIIIPAYNEEARIENSIRTLIRYLYEAEFPYPHAVTIVDNASTDDTNGCVARLVDEYPDTVVSLPLIEKGKGRAVRRGWHERGNVMVFMDADLASDLAFLLPLVDAIVRDGYDIAIGNRLGSASEIRGRKLIRSIASRIYNQVIRLTFGTGISDHQCGFKAIRKDTYEHIAPLLEDTGWFFDTELLVIAKRLGYSIQSIDIRWNDDHRSKVSLFGTTYDMTKAIHDFQKRLPRVIGTTSTHDRRAHVLGQIARFVISGGIAALVNICLFALLLNVFHVQYLVDVIATSVVVFFVSFALQKLWTFDDRDAHSLSLQLPLFILSALATTIANVGLLYLLVEKAFIWPVLGQVLALAAIAAVNFFVYKFLIFRR